MKKFVYHLLLLFLVAVSCTKEETPPNASAVNTLGVERIGFTSVVCKFYSDHSDTTIDETGVCWSISGLPTITDNYSIVSYYYQDLNVYKTLMYNLLDNTTFYARAYTKNSEGEISYGNTIEFKTLKKGTVTVLFQYDYENHAWSDIHSGFFIDSDGNIMGYNMWFWYRDVYWDPMKDPEEYIPLDVAYYTKEDLEYNYYLTDTCFGQVNLDTLNKMKNLVPALVNSTVSEDPGGSDDGGFCSLYAYFWDNENTQYQRILLEVFRDACKKNRSDGADEITNWLFDIMKQKIYALPEDYPDSNLCRGCQYHRGN